MKRILLMLLAVFAVGGGNLIFAKGVFEYRLGEELTLDQVKDGTTPFVLVRVSDDQLIVYGTNGNQYALRNLADVAETDFAYYFKMVPIKGTATYEEKLGEARALPDPEHAFNGDESNDALYMIRPYKRDNNPFSTWDGSEVYVAHCNWTTNAISIHPEDLNFGNDNAQGVEYGCIWKIAESENGYTIQSQSIKNKNYLTGNGGPGASTDWKFYSVAQVLVANTSWTFTKISLEEAINATEPVVMRNTNGEVAYGPFGTWNDGIHVSESDFDSKSYEIKIEEVANGYSIMLKEGDNYNRYFQASMYGHSFLSSDISSKNGGLDGDNCAYWTIAPVGEVGEKQYSIRNVGVEAGSIRNEQKDGYLYVDDVKKEVRIDSNTPYTWEFYTVTNCTNVPIVPTYDKVDADLTTFALSKLKDNKWHFDTPADLFDYKYLVVVTKEASGNKNGNMVLTDNTGKEAGNWYPNEETEFLKDPQNNKIIYNATEAQTRNGMWLDRWNNQICACINLAWIREKGLDIRNITDFSIPDASNIAGVFLTNYATGNAVKNEGSTYPSGDHSRSNGLLDEETAKFGTVALKYTAVVSGAKLYTVDSFDPESGMVLAEKSDYIAEAGVPYIFLTCDFEGQNVNGNNIGIASNVNFFRVDAKEVSDECSNDDARDNGLVGYYDGGYGPGASDLSNNHTYLLSNNQFHLVGNNTGNITLGTNRCFFDFSRYQSPKSGAGAKVRVGVVGSEETAIKDVQNAANDGKIYDMNGREVKSVEKGGMYIMGGMKVYIKK